MRYEMLKPLKLYEAQSELIFPKGERVGHLNAVYMLTKSQSSTLTILNNPFINYGTNLYKYYYTDGIYRERIGRKKVIQNIHSKMKKNFMEFPLNQKLRYIPHTSKKSILKNTVNVIVDMGHWMELYNTFSLKISLRTICENYLKFLATKLNDEAFTEYKKYLFIDIKEWYSDKILSLSRKGLDDPVSILLLTIYRYPELLGLLPSVEFVFFDSDTRQVLKLHRENISKENYIAIKSRLSRFTKLKTLDTINEEESISEDMSEEKQNIVAANRTNIINTLKKNLVGDIPDIADDIIDGDLDIDYNKYDIDIDLNTDDDITELANAYLDSNPEAADTSDIESVANEIEEYVKKKVYIASYMPERTEKERQMIEKFSSLQDNVIKIPPISDLKSKMIDESDFSEYVQTTNPNIIKSKYANFNSSYNTKKLPADIDGAVTHLSKLQNNKVFVTDKIEEDTSDQLNLKKTVTYKLVDEKGKKMTLKFDLPIIIDDTCVYINGSKKVIGHQRVLKPIVHTAPDAVQLVSFYNKIYIIRKGMLDKLTSSLKKYILDNDEHFKVKVGNTIPKNKEYTTSLEFDIFARNLYSFEIGKNVIIMDIPFLLSILEKKGIEYDIKTIGKNTPIGYNKETNSVITINEESDFSEKIISFFNQKERNEFSGVKMNKKLMYAECKILEKSIPIILFMLFCDGFKSVMKKAKVEYKFISKEEFKNYDVLEWGSITLKDGIVIWKRYPLQNSLLMNGLQSIGMDIYTFDELESKETYIYILSQFYQYANMAFNLDQFKDFMIDPVMEEILNDFGYPTDLVELMAVAVEMLTTNSYLSENSLHNMRIRSNEIIAQRVYKAVAEAYNVYRKSQHKKNPASITIKSNRIIADLLSSKLVENSSVLNPILELEKNRMVTFKGESGIGLEASFTIDKRAYDESMLGVLGITTSPDANVGIVRQLTLEPTITSTRGYIDVKGIKNVDDLTAANLLTPAEMLTPLGVSHDDPTRTSMSYKQSKFMVLVEDSDPVMIGNKVESIIPYHTSDEFSVVSKDNGRVIDIKQNIVVVQYNDGRYQSIDTSTQVKKNSAAGFFVESKLKCDKKVGDIVKKGEVIAYNPLAFSKNKNDLSASMKLGVLTKVAIIPNWDIFEDSAPISKKLSDRLSTTMIREKEVVLRKNTFVQSMAKIGDIINTGDPLMVFDQASKSSPLQDKFLESIREAMGEDIINSVISTVKSGYSGEIVDIKIYSSVELDELSPSLREITEEYYKRITKKYKVLNKYSNKDDSKYYKSGNLITESPVTIKANAQGKIKGKDIGEGVLVVFYIKFKDKVKKGDKVCSEFALKSICSHVMKEGYEPYSEYRPDEEISTLVAPLSVTARKTPSIFLAMFGNKLMIEFKRQAKEKYFK